MSQELTVEAGPREDFGKNAARQLRRAGRVPGVVYGGGGPSIPIAIDPKEIAAILHSESGRNAVFTLEIKGKAPARVMLRDWQVEPVHGALLHVDLVRVTRDIKIKVKVPIQVTGEPQGVKVQGGIFDFMLREVEVECLPDDIPDHITVDVSELTIGRNLRVADLPVDPKVKVLTEPARVVCHVVTVKEEEEEKPVEAVAEAAPAEPEVIRKGKAEKEEAEGAEGEATERREASEAKKEGKKEKES